MFDNRRNVTIYEQTLSNGCFSSPKDISFSINRDTFGGRK